MALHSLNLKVRFWFWARFLENSSSDGLRSWKNGFNVSSFRFFAVPGHPGNVDLLRCRLLGGYRPLMGGHWWLFMGVSALLHLSQLSGREKPINIRTLDILCVLCEVTQTSGPGALHIPEASPIHPRETSEASRPPSSFMCVLFIGFCSPLTDPLTTIHASSAH